MFDTATGARLAANTTADTFYNSPLWLDESRNLLLVVGQSGLVGLHSTTLQPIGMTDAPAYRPNPTPLPTGWTGTFGYQVLAASNAPSILTYEWSGATYSYHGGPCLQSALVAFSARTGGRLASRDLAQLAGAPVCFASFVLSTAPAAPVSLHAAVEGRRVTLTWQAPPAVTHYELEVGTTPGARNLGVFTSANDPFVIDNVPSGMYHVRLRALNYSGAGAFTPSLTIVVP